MIDPTAVSTIRVDQLVPALFNLSDNIPHEVNQVLKRGTVQELADLIATIISVNASSGYLPISVTDGQQLPAIPIEGGYFLCTKGTYLNVNGYPDIVCTRELNIIAAVTNYWGLVVEIPIIPQGSSNVRRRFTPTGQTCTLPTGATAIDAIIDGYPQYPEQLGFETDLNTFTQLNETVTFKTDIDSNSQILILYKL